MYKQVLRCNLGNRNGNSANFRRKAGRLGIDNAFSLTNQELVGRYNEAKETSSQMMAEALLLCMQYLSDELQITIDDKCKADTNRIKEMLWSEAQLKE